DRMVLDMHGEPLLAGHEARSARDSPAFHHAVELEPQIVMQARCRVLLDHEGIAAAFDLATPRFRGDVEAAFLPVRLKGHGSSSPFSGACVSRFSSWSMCGGLQAWRACARHSRP